MSLKIHRVGWMTCLAEDFTADLGWMTLLNLQQSFPINITGSTLSVFILGGHSNLLLCRTTGCNGTAHEIYSNSLMQPLRIDGLFWIGFQICQWNPSEKPTNCHAVLKQGLSSDCQASAIGPGNTWAVTIQFQGAVFFVLGNHLAGTVLMETSRTNHDCSTFRCALVITATIKHCYLPRVPSFRNQETSCRELHVGVWWPPGQRTQAKLSATVLGRPRLHRVSLVQNLEKWLGANIALVILGGAH